VYHADVLWGSSSTSSAERCMNELVIKNLYSATIRNAEALSGKNVSHDAAKKGEFSVAF